MSYKILRYTNNDPTTKSWRYKFTLKIYRDCQGSGDTFDSTPGTPAANASIYRLDQRNVPVRTLIFPLPKVTKINPNPGNDCLKVPSNVCVEEGIYELELDLPIIDTSYVISYQRCCRNASISNILNPAQTGATYSVEISANAQKLRVDSPEFINFPPIVLCSGQAFDFDQSVSAPVGDSLVYSLSNPFTGGGSDNVNPKTVNGIAPDPDMPPPYAEVQYVSPTFSASQPLGLNSSISIDSKTGRIQGKPGITGQFVLAISVKQFRNGLLINILKRDFQINIGACDVKIKASLPITTLSSPNNYLFQNCGETKVAFTNSSQDTLAITAYDWTFTGTSGAIFKSSDKNPTIDFLKPGTYNGKLVLNPNGICKDSLFLKVDIPEKVSSKFEIKGDSCRNIPLNITYKGTPNPKSVRWQFDAQAFSLVLTDLNPTFSPSKSGSYKITLNVTGEGNCKDSSTIFFPYYPLPDISKIEIIPERACVGNTIQFSTSPVFSNTGLNVKWDFGDGSSSNSSPSATHTFLKEGTYKVSLLLNGGNGTCIKQVSMSPDLTIRTGPKASFSYAPKDELTLKQTLDLTSSSGPQLKHIWKSGDKILDSTLNISFVLPDTGLIPIRLYVIDSITGCSDFMEQQLYVKPQIRIYIPNAFSPNEDGINDEFLPKGDLELLTNYKLQIFTRWGSPIFISTNPLIGWDGINSKTTENVPMDTYLYVITYTDEKGEKQYFSGTIALMR